MKPEKHACKATMQSHIQSFAYLPAYFVFFLHIHISTTTKPITMATSQSSLYRFPREIRDEIYCLALEWRIEHDNVDEPALSSHCYGGGIPFRPKMRRPRKRTPVLIIALRGDQTLYKEALQMFYAVNTFELSPYTCETILEMPVQALQTIRKWKFVDP